VTTPTPEEMQAKLAAIAARYLDRISKEISQLRTMIDAAASGDLEVVREIETLTHRMHGSGAMLNFDEISGYAGDLEHLAADFIAAGKVEQPRMVPLLEQLEVAIERACANRATTQGPAAGSG
jgi:HPt (histidine-containing phosphotransfer) domain-containing protein